MMKGQKGITLVALIITIIVMLILVGVSISVALNGGLFTKATDAVEETKTSQVEEAIALARANVLANYYDGTWDSYTDVDAYTNSDNQTGMAALINENLDGMTVTVSEFNTTTGTYTVEPPTGVTLTDTTIEFSFWATPAGE